MAYSLILCGFLEMDIKIILRNRLWRNRRIMIFLQHSLVGFCDLSGIRFLRFFVTEPDAFESFENGVTVIYQEFPQTSGIPSPSASS